MRYVTHLHRDSLFQSDLAASSTRPRATQVVRTGHDVATEAPQLVIDEIAKVVTAV